MANSHLHLGGIEVICGSMYSGKTEELMRRLRRAQYARQRVQVFKPKIDTRYSLDHVQSHDANRIHSMPIANAVEIFSQLLDTTRVVGVDEAQFFDAGIVDVVQKLADRGLKVVLAGLDLDFRGKPFGPMPTLMAVAETVTKLHAVCMVCGAAASRSQRVYMAGQVSGAETSEENPVLVGAQESYEARCRFCHDPNPVQSKQGELFESGATPHKASTVTL